MSVDTEKLQQWLNGDYVSPQDFTDSLQAVINQMEQYEKILDFIKPHVDNTMRRINGGQVAGTIPFSDFSFAKQLDRMLKTSFR